MRKKKRSILKIDFIFIFFISITLAMSYALLSTSLNIQGIVSGNYEETPIIDKDSNPNLEVNSINENSWQEETEILIYAGLLHDIGRSNDINDPNHGKKGADKINNLSIFINSLEKRNLLKFIIASHDLELNEDILVKKISKYNITNISSAIKMLLILKDSDALDRTRFTVYGNSSSKLDPSYLNYGFSYKLIDFAQALNNAYEKASISKDENNLKR